MKPARLEEEKRVPHSLLWTCSQIEAALAEQRLAGWAREAYGTFKAKVLNPGFPCTFGIVAQQRETLLYAMARSLHGAADRLHIRSLLTEYLAHVGRLTKEEASFTLLVLFVDPRSLPPDLEAHHQAVWDLLQFLHEADPSPWAPGVSTDPDDPLWSFCLAGSPLFINISSPAHRQRSSRNLGSALTLVIQLREGFDLVAPDTPSGRRVRETIRGRLEAFDALPPYEGLGFYQDLRNREWKQYGIPDGPEPQRARCPFQLRMSLRRSPASLADVLQRRAAEAGDRDAYLFLAQSGEEERLSWGELDARAQSIAAALTSSVPPGARALLLFPPGLEIIAAFFGCLYAGVIAVPAYPPRRGREQRLLAILRDAEPQVALGTSELLAGLAPRAAGLPELGALRWMVTDDLPARSWGGASPEPDAPAFLQYTSGSTARPKGVTVTHANLAHNSAMIQAAFGQDESSVIVGWLPLDHGMGLIGNVLQTLWSGGRCVLMSPVSFLQRPRRWLEAIDRYRATTSGGPSFAYELCASRIDIADRKGLDLSSWKVAFNGAEPVRAETMERFAGAFAPQGFRRAAFYPCYGLAEGTLFVTGAIPGEVFHARPIDAEALERHEAKLSGGGPARRLVSSGRAWGGQRVVIADSETRAELPPGRVGEIWIQGPSVARGYWGRTQETARAFGACLASGAGPFLRTGDLGFLQDGELFVTGRLKDQIILRGRNHYPQDLELTAEHSHPALRPGCPEIEEL